MRTSNLKTLFAVAIALTLLLPTSLLIVTQVQAQAQGGTAGTVTGGPLPAGVTPAVTVEDKIFMSFSPNPIGVGQTLLVNLWSIPAPGANRAHTGYTVTFTKPDGTKDVVGPINSYVADGTAWFEYIPDQVGTWKVQFTYPGDYYPAGRYVNGVLNNSAPPGASFMDLRDYPETWYKPAQTPVQTLIVQNEPVMSWYSPLPNDYWTRPISPENREWSAIGGNFPYAYYNSFVRYCGPFVTAPNTAHIVWRRQLAVAGIIGGEAGQYSIQAQPGTPSVIYLGRCYQTITVPINGVPTSCAVCYDLRTGEQFYSIPVSQGGVTPTAISYIAPSASAQALGIAGSSMTVDLLTVSSGRLYKIDPYSGAVTLNVSISPLTTGVFHSNNYMLSVQTLNATARQYRLINWTTAGSSSSLAARIISNISWPTSMAPGATGLMADFETGVAVGTVAGIFGSASGGAPVTGGDFGLAGGVYGTRIVGISLKTGEVLYNFTTDMTSFNPGSNSVYDGKVFIPMDMGYLDCYDLRTGKLLWRSSEFDYPWGAFGGYNAEAAYGLYYWQTYDGVVAFNTTTGKRVWKYQASATPFETPYTMSNGTSQYAFFGVAMIADGKIYAYNTEHTPSQPITRGWRLHCINATTGEGIWNITGSMQPGAIADGYLTAGNSYDGYMYVFGKGKSTTTVNASPKVSIYGNSVLIEGTVLDLSPAQRGTPCVAKESMTGWMEYLHMQHAIPAEVKGVPVSLDAVDPNGNFVHIGDVITDGMSGTFGFTWKPEIPGQYKVTATFMGDDSYGSSYATTYVSVTEAPPATATPEPPQAPPDYTLTIIGMGIAIMLVVVIVGILILRKRA
ncbi:MAG: PQQ-binding-like beta-propeller repeat protein [Candidatus Bathyarchaeia archaeon]